MTELGTAQVDLGNINLTLPVYVKLNGEYIEIGTFRIGSDTSDEYDLEALRKAQRSGNLTAPDLNIYATSNVNYSDVIPDAPTT